MIDTDKHEGHTEGKWTLEKVEQTDAEHEHYLLIGNNLLLSAIHHGGQEWDEHEANAQLIADAPLLRAEVIQLREENETLRKMDWEYECLWTWLAENTNLLNTIEPLMEEWKKEMIE